MSEQLQLFDEFDHYEWSTDKNFQSGLKNILPPVDNASSNELQVLRIKHYYFSRFVKPFDLGAYLEYKKHQTNPEELYERVEQYDYNNDKVYLKGLSDVVNGWKHLLLGDNPSPTTWDKSRLEMEIALAKAQYYSLHVEQVDVKSYLLWKSKKDAPPPAACPFANIWNNKKSNTRHQVDKWQTSFVVTNMPYEVGPAVITLSSLQTQNLLTVSRLEQLEVEIENVQQNKNATMIILDALALSSSQFEVVDPDAPITTRDTNVATAGLAFNETSLLVNNDMENCRYSMNHLASRYYHLVNCVHSLKKPILSILNGRLPANSTYLLLSNHFIRFITEHARFDLGIQPSHSPIPPLALLKSIAKNLEHTNGSSCGIPLYLALAPPSLVCLRAPDLIKLGIADVFVPEQNIQDLMEVTKHLATCPDPLNVAAVRIAGQCYRSYPGPSKLEVWEEEITNAFSSVESIKVVAEKLRNMDNKWSNTILDHWESIPPSLLQAVFSGVNMCLSLPDDQVLDLEKKLNVCWRNTKDYIEWAKGGDKWEDVHEFKTDDGPTPAEVLESARTPCIYEASIALETEGALMTCPVTGKSGSCPVSKATPTGTCPVTGQKGTAGKCPAGNVKN